MSIETLIALFKDTGSSRQALEELYAAGFRNEFWILGDSSQGWGNESAGTNPFTSSKRQYGGAVSEPEILTRLGISEEDAKSYIDDVARGGVLLIGQVEEDRGREVREIYGRHNPVRTSQPAG
jgi:hypothetical protein